MRIGYMRLSVLTVQLLAALDIISCESRFVTLPQSQTVIEGESVSFTCHATPVAGLEYSWTHNGHILENSSRVHQVGSNLHIYNVIKDVDVGDYVCIATTNTSGARQASPPATLKIIWLTSAAVQLISKHKDEIILKCNVDGSEEQEIEWFRNSEKLESIHNLKQDHNRLIIKNPSSYDNGVYRCVATNTAGRIMSNKSYFLKLSESDNTDQGSDYATIGGCIPRGYSKKSSKTFEKSKNYLCRGKRGERSSSTEQSINNTFKKRVNENEFAELRCDVKTGQQTHYEIRWNKDGRVLRRTMHGMFGTTTAEPNRESMIHEIREDARISISSRNYSLIFTSAILSDEGKYECVVHEEGQSKFKISGELVVVPKLKFIPQPTSKNLELGSMAKIHCKAQGDPSPQVKWYRSQNDDLPETVEDINGTLIFRNVSALHKGVYTCIASNSQGQLNATIDVGVVVAPKFSVIPQGPVQAIEMGVASIHCQAIGDPKPTIRWDKDLQYLNDNNTDRSRFKFLENGTLQIIEVHLDDDGRYGCTIGNSAGLKREEVRFVVKPVEGFTTEESTDGFMITRAVLITMSVAFAYIILVVGLMLWCRYRRQARKARLNQADKENGEACDTANKNAEIEPCLPDKNDISTRTKLKKVNGNNNPKGSGTEAQKSDDTISSVNSKGSKKSSTFDQLAIPRSSLSELIQIGRGEFGDIFIGKIKASCIKISESCEKDNENEKVLTENEKRKSKTSMDDIEEIKEENAETTDEHKFILVKALNKVKDENVCMEFKRQIEMFRALTHKGVAKLFGLCRDKDPHYMVLEYTDWGDLKQFLLATAGKVTNTTDAHMPPLKTRQILALAYQIARGMDAIYRARYIHKDLAARNCVISSDFVVKISYPALCKDKYSREYFKHRNTLLPIRWLAPECIQEDEYTTKSDIFAYAVLVWELFTQAVKLPFEDISNEDYIQRCQNGQIEWRCADTTPKDLEEVLTSCWSERPKERPSFSQLCTALSKSMQATSDK